jgi:ATP-binding cassette subfamily C protein LapB
VQDSKTIRSAILLETLSIFASRYGKAVTTDTLIAGLPLPPDSNIPDLLDFSQAEILFTRAAKRAGFKTTLIERDLPAMLELHLPLILLLAHGQSCILESFNQDRSRARVVYPGSTPLEEWVDIDALSKEYLGFAFLLKKEIPREEQPAFVHNQHKKHWFWDTLKLSWPIYRDVLFASLLVNIFVLASPLFTMNVYDRVIPNNATETLTVFAIGVVTVYILDSFLKYFRTRMLEIAAKKSDVVMSSIIFERVLDLKLALHPKSVGSFASNLKDFDAIRSFLTNTTMTVLIDLPFAILFLLVIYYIGKTIVLIPMVMMLLILVYALIIRKPLDKSIEDTHQAAAHKSGILIETLHNIETIKTQGMTGQVQWQWEESVGDIARKSLYSRLLSASVPTITGLLVQLNTVFIVIYGVYMIRDLELTMGGLIGIVILAGRTVAPMSQVASLMTNYSDARSAFEIIDSITKQPMERLSGHDFIELDSLKGKIEFRNVTFTYPESSVPALKNISFVIEPGEHVGIIGRIGSGKSTIEKLILKLYEPDEGLILIDDVDISQLDPAKLRRHIGYVSQDIVLFRGTVKDNILHRVPVADDEKLLQAARLSGVDEFVRQHPAGYGMPIGERGQGLSGGQRQSIGIARALLSDAPMMLLDEPTNALDQQSTARLMHHFANVFADKTLLLVTQKLELLTLTPRVLVMHEGKLFLDGPRDEVINTLKGRKNEG